MGKMRVLLTEEEAVVLEVNVVNYQKARAGHYEEIHQVAVPAAQSPVQQDRQVSASPLGDDTAQSR